MKPGQASAGLTAVVGVVSVSASGVTPLSSAVGVAGLVLLLGGVLGTRSLGVSLGSLCLAAASVLAGLADASVGAIVLGAGSAALAYDLGDDAIETRRLFDDEAATVAGELVHAAGAGLLVALAGAAVYLVFRATAGRGSTLAVAALLVGATALTAATSLDG